MSASLTNNLRLSSSLKMDEEAKLIERQGIVFILGSDCERAKAASLRRTLSADMSSKKWLAQHSFTHMKKIASSQQFSVSSAADSSSSSSSEGEDEYDEMRKEEEEEERSEMFQTWSSILSQKASDEAAKSGTVPLPYVHPLMKRSASSLSEESLQICTESLGSETGSDGFSSPANTQEDKEEEEEQQQQQLQEHHEVESHSLGKEELVVVERDSYYSVNKGLQPPFSFPPPLPSLSTTQGYSPNVRFQTHRRNGRLVLKAVSVSTQNYFQAQRHGGRLVLTLADMSDQEEEEEEAEELGQDFENLGEEDENGEAAAAEEEEGEVVKVGQANEFMMEMEAAPKLPTGMINVHRSALMMKKLMGLVNINPTWPPKLNKAANLEEATPLLPPPPRVARIITTPPAAAAASSFNAYEYCWRSKPPTPTPTPTPTPKNSNDKFTLSKSSKGHEQQQLLLLRGNKAEYSVPLLRGCKEPRRSLSIWGPYCIATS